MSDHPIREGFDTAKGVLQELVVVVSLVHTLTESFGSASGLYRKLKKKTKHIKEDVKEDLTGTEGNHREQEHERRRSRRNSHSDEDRNAIRLARRKSRSRSTKRREDSRDSDGESIDTSSPLIRAEYDRGFHYLGEKYAVGDLITRNQLQTQIIALQQTVLHIYEDIIINTDHPRHAPSFHLRQLVQATHATRSASIDALAMQYQRMLPSLDHGQSIRAPPETVTILPIAPKRHEGVLNSRPTPENLHCVYARDLQRNRSLPLSDNFKPGGDNRCPYCHAHVSIRANKAWEIVKNDERKPDILRTFFAGTRLMVKCHREGGGFACSLCSEHRDGDTICGEVRALAEHLWKEHSCAELEIDGDIDEDR